MKRAPHTSLQVPQPTNVDAVGKQCAPDGTPYAIQAGDKVSAVEGAGDRAWMGFELKIKGLTGLGVVTLVPGVYGLTLLSRGVWSLHLLGIVASATCLTIAVRTAIKARELFGPPTSSYLERSMLGIFRSRW